MFLDLMTGPVNPAEVVNQLFPNLWILIAHLLATVTLLIMMVRWVYNPFRKAMRRRRNLIRNLIEETRQQQTAANVNLNHSENYLSEAKRNAVQIVGDAKVEAEAKKLVILDQTRKEVVQMNDIAQDKIRQDRQAMQEDARKQIINVACAAAASIIKTEIDEKKHHALINQFIDEL